MFGQNEIRHTGDACVALPRAPRQGGKRISPQKRRGRESRFLPQRAQSHREKAAAVGWAPPTIFSERIHAPTLPRGVPPHRATKSQPRNTRKEYSHAEMRRRRGWILVRSDAVRRYLCGPRVTGHGSLLQATAEERRWAGGRPEGILNGPRGTSHWSPHRVAAASGALPRVFQFVHQALKRNRVPDPGRPHFDTRAPASLLY